MCVIARYYVCSGKVLCAGIFLPAVWFEFIKSEADEKQEGGDQERWDESKGDNFYKVLYNQVKVKRRSI